MTRPTNFIPYNKETYSEEEVIIRSSEFYHWMDKRRTVRDFSDRPIPKKVMENIILTASTAPSGAHKQPWNFCLVGNKSLQKTIREQAEKEEKESYDNRMSDQWLKDLEPLGTNWEKPFLEIAPWIIVVFKNIYEKGSNGEKFTNYYVNESVGIAVGFLLAAIHNAGLVSLTHTPSPMKFLTSILGRPEEERPFLLIPVGYPTANTLVPNLERKTLNEICTFYD